METLGHSSYPLTMETYTHVMPEVTRDAAKRHGPGATAPSIGDDQTA
jgi:integrase